MIKTFIICVTALGCFNVLAEQKNQEFTQSKQATAERRIVIEKKFGEFHQDPYRWMENTHDPALVKWVEQQNTITKNYLAGDQVDELKVEFQQILYGNLLTVQERSSQLDGSEKQRQRLEKFKTLQQKLLPFDQRQQDNAFTLNSPRDIYYVNYGSDSGSDFSRLEIFERETDKKMSETLMVKFPQVVWIDDQSFLYVTAQDGRLADYRSAIYRHTVGQKQPNDQLIYREEGVGATVNILQTENAYFLWRQYEDKVAISRFDIGTGEHETLIDMTEGLRWPFYIDNEKFYVITYDEAPKGKIVSIDQKTGVISTIIPEQEYAIDYAEKVNDEYFVTYIDHVASKLMRFNLESETVENIPLPYEGSARVFYDGSGLVLVMQSYSKGLSWWDYNDEKQEWELSFQEPTDISLESFRTYYKAHNGQDVAIWIVKAKETRLTPDTPMEIYGYGGFTVNLMPRYSLTSVPWYKRGGVRAIVTLPGGREYGEDWHKAGMRENKSNVFADFAAAAKHLITKGYTSSERLVATGGSNGGLLVGAVVNQYPQLFRAAVPAVGVMDMTRYQYFTAGQFWISEYGDANIRSDFFNLKSISPYHNIKGYRYPSVLVLTADFDDRVVPAHSYKYLAKLQYKNRSNNPALLLSSKWSSHGVRGTLSENVDYYALRLAFMLKELGMRE
ncbi:MAG: prolyl oligopeptidase family serine peptidase [Pseudomonadota bacterium]